MRRGLAAAALVLALMPGLAAAGPIALDAAAMRQLANQMLEAGEPGVTLDLTTALLQRDAQDTTALILRAQALRALGRSAEAREAARRAWQVAEGAPGRYGAAMAMAQALATEGRRTLAQFWLRRAVDQAPTPEAEARARRDFAYVRARNPWIFGFDFSIAPSNNVNNGSARGTMDLLGIIDLPIPPDMQALSGLDMAAALSATYRLPSTEVSRTEFELGFVQRSVVLSDEARAQAPTARASDFSFSSIEGSVLQRRITGAPGQLLAFGGTIGHSWYGGSDLADYGLLAAGLDQRLSEFTVLNADLELNRQWRLDQPAQSSTTTTLTLGIDHWFAHLGRGIVELTGRETQSDSPEVAGYGSTARLAWQFARPLPGNISLTTGLTLGYRVYPGSNYALGGRKDRTSELDLLLGFNDYDYLGFIPTLDIRASNTMSNADLFDAKAVGMTVGFRSAF